jgi:hypothetical protein
LTLRQLIKDIAAVGHLVAVCAGKLQDELTYEKPVCDILKVCRYDEILQG